MASVIKLIVFALLDWLVKQTPTIVSAIERWRARRAAAAQIKADEARIDAYLEKFKRDRASTPADPAKRDHPEPVEGPSQ